MYLGKIVESGSGRDLNTDPYHPYTQALLAASPVPDPSLNRRKTVLQGETPSPINPPAGCHFHVRCPQVQERCSLGMPELREVKPGHEVRCRLIENRDPSQSAGKR